MTAATMSSAASNASTSKPSIFNSVLRSPTIVGSSSAIMTFGFTIHLALLFGFWLAWRLHFFWRWLDGFSQRGVQHIIHGFHEDKLHGLLNLIGNILQVIL